MTFHTDTTEDRPQEALDEHLLAGRASFLGERIERGYEGETDSEVRDDAPQSAARELYEVESVAPALAFERWPATDPLPDWIDPFLRLCQWLSETPPSASDTDATKVPFGRIAGVVTLWGRHGVDDWTRLSASARDNFADQLTERLSDLLAQPLHVDYCAFRDSTDRGNLDPGGGRELATTSEQYDRYVERFLDGRHRTFFQEYALLARFVVETVERWQEGVESFCRRLRADTDTLATLLGTDELGDVERVEPGSGDAHAGGQTVTIVEFEAGSVVYKPRSVAPERGLGVFLDRLSARVEGLPQFPTPAVIERDGYGWMEYITSGQFSDGEAVADYYDTAGALSWTLTLLGVTDLHCENILAATDGPVVVDAETAIQPDDYHETTTPSDVRIRSAAVQSSCLGTSLLPFYSETKKRDRSGFGTTEPDESYRVTIQWQNLGTDAIDIEYGRSPFVPDGNHPRYEGDPAPPWLFESELAEGFERAQDATTAVTETVQDTATESFHDTETRVLVRQSILYQLLLDTLSNPEYLRDGGRHERKLLDVLWDRWDESALATRPAARSATIAAERDALLGRDIPRFTVAADETELRFDGDPVASDAYRQSGLAATRDRIETLSSGPLDRQRAIFRATFSDNRLAEALTTDGGET